MALIRYLAAGNGFPMPEKLSGKTIRKNSVADPVRKPFGTLLSYIWPKVGGLATSAEFFRQCHVYEHRRFRNMTTLLPTQILIEAARSKSLFPC